MLKPLTQERLKELLHYDPLTGVFRWKIHIANVRAGGLTYAGAGIDPSPDRWWFGFDCAHSGDLSPGLDALMRRIHIENGTTKEWEERSKLLNSHQTYRTMDYVRNECADLARQLKALEVAVDVTSYTSDRSE